MISLGSYEIWRRCRTSDRPYTVPVLNWNEADDEFSLIMTFFLYCLLGRRHTNRRLDTPCIHFISASEVGSLREADWGAWSTNEANHSNSNINYNNRHSSVVWYDNTISCFVHHWTEALWNVPVWGNHNAERLSLLEKKTEGQCSEIILISLWEGYFSTSGFLLPDRKVNKDMNFLDVTCCYRSVTMNHASGAFWKH